MLSKKDPGTPELWRFRKVLEPQIILSRIISLRNAPVLNLFTKHPLDSRWKSLSSLDECWPSLTWAVFSWLQNERSKGSDTWPLHGIGNLSPASTERPNEAQVREQWCKTELGHLLYWKENYSTDHGWGWSGG